MRSLGLYIHIPFCKRKCNYCDFYSLPTSDTSLISSYVDALCSHIRLEGKNYSDFIVDSIFFGGGTPSLLSEGELTKIFEAINSCLNVSKNAEISLEANPGTLDFDKLSTMRRLGVNRLSIGLQSSHSCELSCLGRIHNLDDFENSYAMAREAGFDNISVDIMYALPNQKIEDFLKTLDYVLKKAPEHISSYCLKIEGSTPFAKTVKPEMLPSEDTQYEMYLKMCELLEKNGYEQYEISNFARNGKRCYHNMKYWLSMEYVSFGPSAHSYLDGKRYSYKNDISEYISDISNGNLPKRLIEDEIDVTQSDRRDEYVMLKMRLCDGISNNEFKSLFGTTIEEAYPQISTFVKSGHIKNNDGRYSFTKEGFFVSSYILSEILF